LQWLFFRLTFDWCLFLGSLLANTAENAKLFDMARSVHWLPKDAGLDRPQKKRGVGEESEDEEPIAISGSQPGGPPPNDIYRKRQQKRVK
jgi:hypothetical protein